MSEARIKLQEAQYFLELIDLKFRQHSGEFVYHLNAFINSSRNVTFVLQQEYSQVEGFSGWYKKQPLQHDEEAKRFINLRNISLKQKTISPSTFEIRGDFGPNGLQVNGMKGPTRVLSDPIRFDQPIPKYSYVTVDDDSGHRRVRYTLTTDFRIIEQYDDGKKTVEFISFLHEAREHLSKLEALISDAESRFESKLQGE